MSYKYWVIEEACYRCGHPCHFGCHSCQKPLCSGCVYKTGRMIEDGTSQHQEELCITCYEVVMGHAPFVLWQGSTSVHVHLVLPTGVDMQSIPPTANAAMLIRDPLSFAAHLDAFKLVQLLDFLQANELLIRREATATSGVFVPLQREQTQREIDEERSRLQQALEK